MSTDRLGYDTYSSQFSPEGRIYQVEYATKATLHSGTAIGMRGNDGIVLAAANFTTSPLLEAVGSRRTFTIDRHIGAVVAGFMPDARHIVNVARDEANYYRKGYDLQAPLSYVMQNVSTYVHAHTLHSCVRPFGASLILGACTPDGPQLFCIQPSGAAGGYFGCAIGKAADAARSEMENVDLENSAPIMQLVKDAAKIIYAVHDGQTDFELDLSWSGEITNGRHESVPLHIYNEAKEYAKEI